MIYHGFLGYSEIDKWYAVVSGSVIIPDITGELGNYKEVYYLKTLPMGTLCNCTLDDYSCKNGEHVMTYGDGTIIRLNGENVEIKNGERYLTKNGNTLVEGYKDDEHIGYAKSGSFRMKKYFEGNISEVIEIGRESTNIEYQVNDDYICIDTNAGTAFKIYVD